MRKAVRNSPLTGLEPLDNRLVSKVRAIVARSFGTPKRIYGFVRSRCVGLVTAEMEFLLSAMACTLKKGLRLALS